MGTKDKIKIAIDRLLQICFSVVMLICEHKMRGRKKGGKWKFPGLVADAAALGVSPSHLWRVLVEKRKSARLTEAYETHKRGLSNPTV